MCIMLVLLCVCVRVFTACSACMFMCNVQALIIICLLFSGCAISQVTEFTVGIFLRELNLSFGSGGMGCWFKDKELPQFIHHLKKDLVLPVKQAAKIVGKQPDDSVWVMSPYLQVLINIKAWRTCTARAYGSLPVCVNCVCVLPKYLLYRCILTESK